MQLQSEDGKVLIPPGPRARSLIIAAALGHGQLLSADQLIDDVWGAEAPSGAKTALHTLISRTRSLDPGILHSSSGGYRLGIEAEQVDLWYAEKLHQQASSTLQRAPAEAVELCDQALRLWRNPPGIDAADSPARSALEIQASRLEAELKRCRSLGLAAARRWEEAIEALSELTAVDQLDERLGIALVRSLQGAGRTAEALAQLERYRRILRTALGVSLSPEASALQQELLQESNSKPQPEARIRGLRAPVNQLLGRQGDIEELTGLLQTSRVVSILGPGGLGKTRLAMELAASAAVRTSSVVFLELASVRDGADIWLALGSVLGINEPRQKPGIAVVGIAQRIMEQLQEHRTLLVVDNCEHLIEAVASTVAELIAEVASLTVLCTSRAPLNIAGEYLYLLPPLATSTLPGEATPAAIELFMQRARAARSSAPLDAGTVSQLCERLDGLPLAIELAAARIRTMSVSEILERISERFTLLRSQDRTIEERHRTLHAVIEWSWSLLSSSEQSSLRRLCSFPDGFSREAAILVAGADRETPEDVEADLEALLNQSLLRGQEHPLTGQMRYRMLETVREFGGLEQRRAQEQAFVSERMLLWAKQFCQNLFSKAYGPEQLATVKMLTMEQDNLIHLLRQAITERKSSEVFWIFALLGNCWTIRSFHQDVAGFAEQVLDAVVGLPIEDQDVPAALTCFTIISATLSAMNSRLSARARAGIRRMLNRGIPVDDHLSSMSTLWLNIGSRKKLLQALEQIKQSPDAMTRASGQMIESFLLENSGQVAESTTSALNAYRLGEEAQDTWTMGTMAASLAQLYVQRAEHEQSLLWGQRALRHLKELDAVSDIQQLHAVIVANQLATGQLEAARATLEASMDELPDEESEISGLMLALRAEVELSSGNLSAGLENYRIIAEDPRRYRDASGYGAVLGSAAVCAFLLHQPDAEVPLRRWVKQGRIRCLAAWRLNGDMFIDQPVIGAVALTVGSWAAQTAVPGSEKARRGLELLLLSNGRQDLPSLLRERHLNVARRRLGTETFDAAVRSRDELSSDARLGRIRELLSDQALRI
ncbi:BTAD domain-containing putative transcriptional regulator [Psychromicrobium sp. YIM B11713]|uniref:BTAD domain-containing putative transcriptional regulator n=1 Tax=Psychromicrobium sp. YIM B11713 TaxID=3145233 RepID=UPI00374F7AD8